MNIGLKSREILEAQTRMNQEGLTFHDLKAWMRWSIPMAQSLTRRGFRVEFPPIPSRALYVAVCGKARKPTKNT